MAYDAAHQPSRSTHDTLGRVTRGLLNTYTWDLASRLTSYSGPNGQASFTYDALGQRISRTAGGSTQNYVLNYALPLPSLAVVRSANADQHYYVWLPVGTLLESIGSDNSRRFYHFEESRSTSFLTGDDGAVTDTYAMTPDGATVQHTGPSTQPFTFQGADGVMQEGATGLFYMRERYYHSASARFLSRDPVPSLDPRAINPYQYALGNPLARSDPSGRSNNTSAFVPPGLRAEGLACRVGDSRLDCVNNGVYNQPDVFRLQKPDNTLIFRAGRAEPKSEPFYSPAIPELTELTFATDPGALDLPLIFTVPEFGHVHPGFVIFQEFTKGFLSCEPCGVYLFGDEFTYRESTALLGFTGDTIDTGRVDVVSTTSSVHPKPDNGFIPFFGIEGPPTDVIGIPPLISQLGSHRWWMAVGPARPSYVAPTDGFSFPFRYWGN